MRRKTDREASAGPGPTPTCLPGKVAVPQGDDAAGPGNQAGLRRHLTFGQEGMKMRPLHVRRRDRAPMLPRGHACRVCSSSTCRSPRIFPIRRDHLRASLLGEGDAPLVIVLGGISGNRFPCIRNDGTCGWCGRASPARVARWIRRIIASSAWISSPILRGNRRLRPSIRPRSSAPRSTCSVLRRPMPLSARLMAE